MCCSINTGNHIHLYMHAKVERPDQKFTEINTIVYDIKYNQLKMTIEKCTYIRQKILKILTNQKRDIGIDNKYVTQL